MEIDQIRNFSIISHIDHGKSTLADRLLETTQTIQNNKMRDQFLDQMDLEQEKGITIKMQPVRMKTQKIAERDTERDTENRGKNKSYTLNLIDTPGHMDFSYEVERALQACEGALLLVSAKEGIQAQTLANLRLAQKQGLKIIPVINKIDLSNVEPEKRALETAELLNEMEVEATEPLFISAKTGENIEKLLETIVTEIPAPKERKDEPLKSLIFDSVFDTHKGVIAFARIFSGSISSKDQIKLYHQKKETRNQGVGFFEPRLAAKEKLKAGEIGWIATGIKESTKVQIGDTITKPEKDIEPIQGYKKPQPMVFANIFPIKKNDFQSMQRAFNKLMLNDPALEFENASHPTLGRGLRIGVLGKLHLEVTLERLQREFKTEVKVTPPSVSYQVTYKQRGETKTKECSSPASFPHYGKITKIKEPITKVNIVAPIELQSKIHKLVQQARGNYLEAKTISSENISLYFEVPLAEIMIDFNEKLKSLSQGFASFSYQVREYREGDLAKLEFLIAGEKKEGLSLIVSKQSAGSRGRKVLKKLKKHLPRQPFPQKLQARMQGRVIAREDIKALKKDVTEDLYGGDYSRKKKLLKNQREGQKKLKEKGQVEIPKEVYHKLLDFS